MGLKNILNQLFGKSVQPQNDPSSGMPGNESTNPQRIQFFLCFSNQTQAVEIRDRLESQGMDVELRLAEDYTNWLTVIIRNMLPQSAEFLEFEASLIKCAESNDGEYLGWEAEKIPGLNLYSID